MAPSLPADLLVVDAVGARIGIDVSGLDATSRTAVTRAWKDALAPGPATADTVVTPSADAPLAQMLSDLSSTVTQAAISAGRGTLLMLHAAGLAAADGRVSVLVGPSGAGKTTATRALARHRGYVSDETVGIRTDGEVHAYRKPLSVITEGHAFKVQSSPGELGLRPLPDAPLRLARFVLLDRRADPTPAQLTPVPDFEALTALAPHCSALAVLPRPLRTMARLLGETGGALRAQYSEASDLVALLSDMDAAHPAPSAEEPTETAPDPSVEGDIVLSLDGGASGPRYRRPEVADWVPLADGRLAVLTAAHDGGGTLRVLAGLAPLLWEIAAGAPRDAIVRTVVDDIGDPAAEAGVLGILDELVGAGLLELSS